MSQSCERWSMWLAELVKVRLRVTVIAAFDFFGGNTPSPTGEEPMEYWLEQAMLMVPESELTEQEKALHPGVFEKPCFRGCKVFALQ